MRLSNPGPPAPLRFLPRRVQQQLAGRWSSGLGLRDTLEVETTSRRVLMYVIVPAWLAAGLLDYLFHRRTHIERNAGARESLLHGLMMAEAGAPTLAALFLDVNAGVLASAAAALVAHEATSIWDIAYANPRRFTSPTEQHIHSFLEVLPVMGTAFVFVLHPRQALALLGLGGERPRFALGWKRPPLPAPYLAAVLGAVFLFGVIPYAEEFIRCLRTKFTLAAQPLPPPEAAPAPYNLVDGAAPNGDAGGRAAPFHQVR